MSPGLGLGLGLHHPPGTVPEPPPPDYPAWLPTAPSGARPLAAGDFANGNYWDGTVTTLTELFIQDTDFGTFTSASVHAGEGLGWDTSGPPWDGQPTLEPSATAQLLSGFTMVLEVAVTDPGSQWFSTGMVWYGGQPGWAPAFSATLGAMLHEGFGGTSAAATDTATENGTTIAAAGNHAMAATFDPDTGIEWAVDGIAQPSAAGTGTGFNLIGLQVGGQGQAGTVPISYFATSVAFYPPQPLADLPALSTPS